MTEERKDGRAEKRLSLYIAQVEVPIASDKADFLHFVKLYPDKLRASLEVGPPFGIVEPVEVEGVKVTGTALPSDTAPAGRPDRLIVFPRESMVITWKEGGQTRTAKTINLALPFWTVFMPHSPDAIRCFIEREEVVITGPDSPGTTTDERAFYEWWKATLDFVTKRNAQGQPVSQPGAVAIRTVAIRTVAIRAEYFKAPGRMVDTPRYATAQGDLPAIERWYLQTAFNRTVGMAAAALTKTDTREDILGVQKATVEEIEDLVFWREEGAAAHGQHRQDILKAFEALRAIPVPIVKIDWKQVGTDRNARFVKVYKLGVGQMVQTYWPFWKERATGKIVYAADPVRKKELVASKPDRRKKTRALVEANPVEAFLNVFPPDKYEVAGFEWRWNTDIAEDFICPSVALTKDSRPRLKLTKGRHVEGSRFVMVNRRYFAVQKHLRAAGMRYAARLLDLIISEKTHIDSRGKGAVWIEIQAEKVIKWLGLWPEYHDRPKHVLENHIGEAIMALIAEGVMLPGTWPLPKTPPNKDRRTSDVYRWKVAEMWSTVALVSEEEAKEIEKEQAAQAEAEQAAGPAPAPVNEPKAEQVALPIAELPPALPIPSGADIRAAREAAGVNLRTFARMMKGPSFKTWSLIETGQRAASAGRIPETVWQRVRDFVEKHGPKSRSEDGSVT
jgi:hypothetical protein